jgi:phosphatidylethanolamine-binding protein (PEBP) family uncharacterized protein
MDLVDNISSIRLTTGQCAHRDASFILIVVDVDVVTACLALPFQAARGGFGGCGGLFVSRAPGVPL